MNSNKRNIILLFMCLIFVIFIPLLNLSIQIFLNLNDSQEGVLNDKPETSIYEDPSAAGYFIDDSNPDYNWSKTAAEKDWCYGSGTWNDPYIIENLTFNGGKNRGLVIRYSTKFFIIRNCSFSGAFDESGFAGAGIYVFNVDNGKIQNNTCSNNDYGMDANQCDNLTISENVFNDNTDYGLRFGQGDHNNISGNIFKRNMYGLSLSSINYNNITSNIIEDCRYGLQFSGQNNNILTQNNMTNCGFYTRFSPFITFDLNTIDTTNLVNGKPLFFYKDNDNLDPSNFTNAGQVFLINCRQSLISDLDITNSGIGVTLLSCSNVSISNINSSFNTISGFSIYRCNNITVNNIMAKNNEEIGISILSGYNNTLVNNKMYNCGLRVSGSLEQLYSHQINTSNRVNNKPIYYTLNKTGLDESNFSNAGQIILVNCNKSSISNLELSNCSFGMILYYCFNNTLSRINTSNNFIGIWLFNGNYNTINETICTSSRHGLVIVGKNNTISGNFLFKNQASGVYVVGDGHVINNNYVVNNQEDGIVIGGNYNNFTNNYISKNADNGIDIQYGKYNKIYRNNITNNENNGINFDGSDINSVSSNNISNNKNCGIYFTQADSNQISGNEICNNLADGIFFYESSYSNQIQGNNIKGNGKTGVVINENNFFTLLINNNFSRNQFHAEDNGTFTEWDNGTIGNYWDNYTGVDDNDDGIGDTPYTFIHGSAGTQDDYPIWWDPPAFSIISPIDNQIFGNDPPEFIIEIEKGNRSKISMWYLLNTLTTKYYFISNNSINQEAWDALTDDTIEITFFVNDSAGKVVYKEVVVRKDNIDPIIIINSPQQNKVFGDLAPSFELFIIEDNLDEIWYSLDEGISNYSCSLSGQIDQAIWDELGGGSYVLRFYANDTLENVGYSEITIKKKSEAIYGFEISIILFSFLVSVVAIIYHFRRRVNSLDRQNH